MARIVSDVQFIGSMGDISAYRMKGVDHIVVRRKGGPSKQKIKKSPRFENTRRNIVEFSGRARAAKWVRKSLMSIKALADYNFTGSINAILKPIQEMDRENRTGERHIVLSKNPKILEGFSLNRKAMFDSVVRNSVSHSISRDELSAQLDIPALIPGITLVTPQRYAMFSFVAELGIMPDMFQDKTQTYFPTNTVYGNFYSTRVSSEWYPVGSPSPGITLDLKLNHLPPDTAFSLILSIGIRYGVMHDAKTINQIKHAGSAKIIGAV